MVQIAVTGNIGSGKTTICGMMESMGIPVYHSDDRAKGLMNQNKTLMQSIQKRFGQQSYLNGMLNRSWLSNLVFNDADALDDLNRLVHPVVRTDYKHWSSRQSAELIAYESAILIEHGNQADFDVVILVQCPKSIRFQRIHQRDELTMDAIQARARFQWSEEKKAKFADFLIENIALDQTEQQLQSVMARIRKQFLKD